MPAESASPSPDTVRSNVRADLTWFLRHRDALARWPVLGEEWAQAVERHRLADASPGRGVMGSGPGADTRAR